MYIIYLFIIFFYYFYEFRLIFTIIYVQIFIDTSHVFVKSNS